MKNTAEKAKDTFDVWIARDDKKGDEPDLLFIYVEKPKKFKDGTWASDLPCMAVPDVKHGKCKKLRLALA